MNFEVCGFEHLHRHTDGSLLDGFATPEEYAIHSSKVNQNFLVISDHGMMSAIPRQIRACDKICDKFKDKDKLSPIFACLPKGHGIHVLGGSKDISEIKIGDLVLTHKGRFRKVIRIFKNEYNGNLYSIYLGGNTKKKLSLTGEHPVLIRDYDGRISWVKSSEILTGRPTTKTGIKEHLSFVCVPKFNDFVKVDDVDLSKFQKEDIFVNKDGFFEKNKYGYKKIWDKLSTTIKLSKEFAYFLGMFAAEGSFSKKKNRFTGGARFSLNAKELNFANYLSLFLKSIGVESSCYIKNNKMDLCFCCLPLCNYLIEEVGVGFKNKKIPNVILNSDLDIQKAFLDGLLDGDGKKVTNKNKQKTLRIGSKNLAWQTRFILTNLGYWTSVTPRSENRRIIYNLPIQEDKKYDRYLNDDNFVYKPIKQISVENYSGYVYNFEVEEDNSYVSDFALHNCELYYNEMQPAASNSNELKLFTKDLNDEEKKRFRKSSHLLAIAFNETGYKNLVRLSSWGWTKGFYSRPRINREMLEKHKEGIIFTSCCYASEVGKAFDEFGEDAANDVIQKYIDIIGKENYYLEIMLLDFKKQKPYDAFIIKAKEKFGLKLILTNDCHYCTKEDSKYQRLMLMVQTKKTLADIEKAMSENDMQDFFELQDANLWMKSEEELNEKWEKDYKDIIPYELFCEAKRETVRVCQKAKGVKLDRSIKFPEYDDADEKLWEKIKIGLKKRGFTKLVPKNYSDRITEEYSLICRKGFSSYFIIQQKMTDEARRACPEILGWGDGSEAMGCGRGSAVGSLICYLLGITDVDPVEEDLLFSRFLSESRGGRRMKLEFDEEDFVE